MHSQRAHTPSVFVADAILTPLDAAASVQLQRFREGNWRSRRPTDAVRYNQCFLYSSLDHFLRCIRPVDWTLQNDTASIGPPLG